MTQEPEPTEHDELLFVPRAEFERVAACAAPDLGTRATRAALYATLARINTLHMISTAGSGHIGSSFSSLDLLAWLFLEEMDPQTDRYFSSKGHDAPGLYAILTARGVLPFEQIHRLRRLGGLPGHPDVGTPGMVANTGSLGMGISKAKGLATARRLRGEGGRIFVMTGDGELQEGQLWESLATAVTGGFGEITVVVDHNKLQSDTWVEATSSLGDLDAKFAAFGWRVARCDGHDPADIARGLADLAEDADRPKVLIADTIKGRGVSFMEPRTGDTSLYGYHSGAPDAATHDRAMAELTATAERQLADLGLAPLARERRPRPQRPVPPAGAQRLVGAYGETLLDLGRERDDLVALDADLVLDCGLIPFRDAFPERFVECGIAEQDMVSQAGGMALDGLLPVVHSFACFLTTRANEQIYNNATEGTKIVYAGSLAGLVPAGPGHSHQSVRDISALAAVPGLVLIEPCCERETRLALRWAVEENAASTYLRLVSIPCDLPFTLPADHALELGRGTVLHEGDDVVVIGYGPVLLAEAYRAAEALASDGIGVRLVNLPWLNRVDGAWLAEAVRGVGHVLTLDNHYVTGGQGEMVAARLAEEELAGDIRLLRLGLREVPVCGTNAEALAHHGLDAASLREAVRALTT